MASPGWPRTWYGQEMTLNFWSSCFYFLIGGITGMSTCLGYQTQDSLHDREPLCQLNYIPRPLLKRKSVFQILINLEFFGSVL